MEITRNQQTKYRLMKDRNNIQWLEYLYNGRFLLVFAWDRWLKVPSENYYGAYSTIGAYINSHTHPHIHNFHTQWPDIFKYFDHLRQKRKAVKEAKKRKVTYLN